MQHHTNRFNLVSGHIALLLNTICIAAAIVFTFAMGCEDESGRHHIGPLGESTPTIEPATQPAFVLDASQPFLIELGKGSAPQGMDIIKIDQTGNAQISRIPAYPYAESATIQLTSANVATLVELANDNKLTSMGRSYINHDIADGTQWILWIEQGQSHKAIYFSNAFPHQITTFSSGLHSLLDKAGLKAATWEQIPEDQILPQQKALWERIR